jgi:hypothetical protein
MILKLMSNFMYKKEACKNGWLPIGQPSFLNYILDNKFNNIKKQ